MSSRVRDVDRFYNPRARRHLEQLKRAATAQASLAMAVATVPAEKIERNETIMEFERSAVTPSVLMTSSVGNLERFLESTAPVVSAMYFPKMSLRGWRSTQAVEAYPYFYLGDLWESFKEWSAYGAGVRLVLDGSDSVVQYYVPYLSAIQLYSENSRPTSRFRRPGEDSDGDTYLDSSSDGSSECDIDQMRQGTVGVTGIINHGGIVGDNTNVAQKILPIFEYLERNPPHGREPLADKISSLISKFPELKTYKSCDLLPSSWMSVAWYPIYRIPTGPTLKDLDACFLTYHMLATPRINPGGAGAVANLKLSSNLSNKLTLPVFGLASYKFRGSIWTSNGLHERQLASALLQAADNWLRYVQVDHPDYRFFISHYNGGRR